MSNDLPPPPKIAKGPPESFGWQRAPQYDTQTGICYESPIGALMLFPRDKKPALARFKGNLLRDLPKA